MSSVTRPETGNRLRCMTTFSDEPELFTTAATLCPEELMAPTEAVTPFLAVCLRMKGPAPSPSLLLIRSHVLALGRSGSWAPLVKKEQKVSLLRAQKSA